jgi:hypothetical protein
MRTARLVGLSPDGKTLIVATDSGEQLAIVADARLRAAVRGDRPRLGQLEIQMETALSPREIQSRIRSGQTLEDVTRAAGIPVDRVERFAAPVLAEREHIAAMALASSVRRRGETSGHRNLRIALTERLLARGVDIDTLEWDSYRVDGGRWAVTAGYRSGESSRQALFYFDVAGRFSVAGNDDARWVLGEQSPAKGPQPGRRRPVEVAEESADDTEPTLDLSDDLAIVRAVQDFPVPPQEVLEDAEHLASVQELRPAAPAPLDPEPDGEGTPGEESALDTLYAMLDSDSEEVAEADRGYAGLNDATAVPEAAARRGAGWEPAIVVNYPVEPSLLDDEPVTGSETGGTDEPGTPDRPTGIEDREDEADALVDEHAVQPTPAEVQPRATKRKRAAVPSWDQIMFGGPKRS